MPWTVEKQYVLELDQPLQPPVTRTVHRDGTATIASGSVISKGSLVGRGSIVESGTRLERSIIGSDCHIGRCAFLQGSCLHGGVRVDDSCLVSSAVLGEQVVVRAHARVEVRSWWPTHGCGLGGAIGTTLSACSRQRFRSPSILAVGKPAVHVLMAYDSHLWPLQCRLALCWQHTLLLTQHTLFQLAYTCL